MSREGSHGSNEEGTFAPVAQSHLYCRQKEGEGIDGSIRFSLFTEVRYLTHRYTYIHTSRPVHESTRSGLIGRRTQY